MCILFGLNESVGMLLLLLEFIVVETCLCLIMLELRFRTFLDDCAGTFIRGDSDVGRVSESIFWKCLNIF